MRLSARTRLALPSLEAAMDYPQTIDDPIVKMRLALADEPGDHAADPRSPKPTPWKMMAA